VIPRSVRILLAREPVDMRNSIDGLAAIVRGGWQEDVFTGHLFVFASKRGNRVKILTWDNGGFILFYKRLEQGRFRLPAFREGTLGAQLDGPQLAMLLDGIDLSRVRRPKKWTPELGEGDRQNPVGVISTTRWSLAPKTTRVRGAPKRSG